jgi:outer membrane lipoprotein-sorting protein
MDLSMQNFPGHTWARRMRPTAALFAILTPFAVAFSQDPAEIIRRSENAIKGETSRGTFIMTVVTPSYTRRLEMESWWVGNTKALIVVTSPKKEAGNKTLRIGNEMWSYLRNTETTIKIPPSMMLQSWNGSDFTNDDLVRESDLTEDYGQTLLGPEDIEGARCWKIRLVPHPDVPVVWGRIDYWVRQSDYLPARQEYFDERGTLVRTMEFSDFRTMGGRKIPAKWVMINNAKEGHRTEFGIREVAFDVPISDRIFSLRELERGL